MAWEEWTWMIVIGVSFVVIGFIMLASGRGEEKSYYDSLASRADVREFVSHQPERAEPGSLKIGAWIALSVGILLVIIGVVFLAAG